MKLPLLLLLLPGLLWQLAAANGAPQVCGNRHCRQLSLLSAQMMNASANACENFYEFACGGYGSAGRHDPDAAYRIAEFAGLNELLLHRGIPSDMDAEVRQRVFELLAVDDHEDGVGDEVATMARGFFDDCVRWRLRLDRDGVSTNESRGFFDDLLRVGLLQRLWPSSEEAGTELEAEEQEEQKELAERLLAAVARSGADGLLTVTLRTEYQAAMNWTNFTLARVATAELFGHHGYLELFGLSSLLRFVASLPTARGLLRLSSFSFFKTLWELQAVERSAKADASNCSCCSEAGIDDAQGQQIVSVQQLQQLSSCLGQASAFNWTSFFADLLRLPPASVGDLLLTVDCPLTVASVANFLKADPPPSPGRHLSKRLSFAIFDWLMAYSSFLPRGLQHRWELSCYREHALKPPHAATGASSCLLWTQQLLLPALERMYQRKYFPNGFCNVRRIVGLLIDTAIEAVQRQAWISNSSKLAAAKKLRDMEQNVGLQQLTDDELRRRFADSLVVGSNDGLRFGSRLAAALTDFARSSLDAVAGRRSVHIFTSVGALIVDALNIMDYRLVFPMGILLPPVYHDDYPDAVNLGGLGQVVGHALAHSFDANVLLQPDRPAHDSKAWDSETEAQYQRRVGCVHSRVSQLREATGFYSASSNVSAIEEDVSDIIGLSLVSQALRRLSARQQQQQQQQLMPSVPASQQLFLRAAQQMCEDAQPQSMRAIFERSGWSPGVVRVNSMMMNSELFAAAFGCGGEAAMNPRDKCIFW